MKWRGSHAALHRRRSPAPPTTTTAPVLDLDFLQATPTFVERDIISYTGAPAYTPPPDSGLSGDGSSSGSDSSSSSSSSSGSSSSGSDSSSSDSSSSSTGSSSSSSTTCPANSSDPACQRPTGSVSNNSLAIILGVLVPLLVAFCAFFYLHRRYKQRLRLEDANDKHASLDFGLGEVSRKVKGKKGKGGPEMSLQTTERMLRTGRGMSMDMNSPYVLPSELTGSRPSFHSLSRSAHDEGDPYSPIALVVTREPSPSGLGMARKDSASVFTQSSDTAYHGGETLLGNAQKPSRTSPPNLIDPFASPLQMPEPTLDVHRKPVPTVNVQSLPSVEEHPASFQPPPRGASKSTSPPPVPQKNTPQIGSVTGPDDDDGYEPYTDVLGIVQRDAARSPAGSDTFAYMSNEPNYDLNVTSLGYDPTRLSTSIRPLPDYDPNDTAEQRANRIRSFYKEYFDDSKGPQERGDWGDYYEDYDADYAGRRAMTPPARGPPKFKGKPNGRNGTSSGGSYPRQRAQSSASHKHPQPRGRPAKRLPPPKPLNNLPTPYLLQTDPGIMSTIDFLPPSTMRDRQMGRSDSPLLGSRPYSPSVKAFTPLASSFSELPFMPSPHQLRKSSTFTALDFAPPPRLGREGGSDSGSIRSGHSNVSPYLQANIRAGAYRLSRLPKETVGTKDDLAATLKPRWDIGR